MDNNNPLNTFFDKIYCINLDKRRDRWAQASSEFKKYNLVVERISAIDGSRINMSGIKMNVLKNIARAGAVGCSLSHINVIKRAKEKGYSKILILEDDVVFEENFIERFTNEIKHLPENWDMFYLSGNNLKSDCLTRVNNFFYKTTFTFTTHSYAISSAIFDEIIKGASKLEEPIDEFYRKHIQQNYNCYIIRPHLSYQRPGFSDIMGGDRDYKNIRN
jgi:GR25 family glycosyltransferase involved in LPS biosynthesis